MGKIKLAGVEECTGCMACAVACKRNAITFVEMDGLLHNYPFINEDLCVECNKCVQSCPIISFNKFTKIKSFIEPETFCAWHIDKSILQHSTSGGVGTALAETAIKLGYKVVGARFDDKWHLSHSIAEDYEDLSAFAGSKYLLSDDKDSIRASLSFLNAGQKIFFIGTPCQCAAMAKLVPLKNAANLLTCSIICHGVNSPLVWKDYIGHLENENGSKLTYYNFRSKAKGWGKLLINYKFSSGKEIEQKARYNLFHVWFGKHYMQRLSCFNCKYRTKERFSDFIIGDFWGIEKILPNLKTHDGVSVLIVNSNNAQAFFKQMNNIVSIKTDYLATCSVLKGFIESQNGEQKEKEISDNIQFARDYRVNSFKQMSKMYPVVSFKSVLIDYICSQLKIKKYGKKLC